MTIFFRYAFRQAGGALLLILGSLGGIVWIALALKKLNVVTSQGQDAFLLLKMTTLALPNLLAVVAPFALLIAVMHTLSRLNADSELIVMTAAGGTIWTVAKPLLFLGLLVSVAVGFVNHVGMPWSLQQLRAYIIQVRTDLLTQVIQPGRFSSPEKGLTFHIRERSQSGELHGLILNDTRNEKLQQSFLAERGQIVKQGGSAFMIMFNGHILRRSNPQRAAEVVVFEKYPVDLDRFDKKTDGPPELKPRERYFNELIGPRPDDELFNKEPGHMRAELHERLANPLYPIAFVLIALATVGQAQSTRQNRVERTVIGFVGAAGCRLGGLAVNNLVVLNPVYVPLLYLFPLVASAIALAMMVRNSQPRRGIDITGHLVDLYARWLAPVANKLGLRKKDRPVGAGPATPDTPMPQAHAPGAHYPPQVGG